MEDLVLQWISSLDIITKAKVVDVLEANDLDGVSNEEYIRNHWRLDPTFCSSLWTLYSTGELNVTLN